MAYNQIGVGMSIGIATQVDIETGIGFETRVGVIIEEHDGSSIRAPFLLGNDDFVGDD